MKRLGRSIGGIHVIYYLSVCKNISYLYPIAFFFVWPHFGGKWGLTFDLCFFPVQHMWQAAGLCLGHEEARGVCPHGLEEVQLRPV